MADVTSTARLIVTVEGEDKIRRLAAQLKALGAAGGTKRFGVGTGIAGPLAAANSNIRKSLAPVVAAQAATARVLKPIAAQQAVLAKSVAPLVAGQVATAKMVKAWTAGVGKPGGAMTVPPSLVKQQAKAVVSAMAPATAAVAAAQKQWLAQRKVAPAAPVAPATGGLTPNVIRSIQKRNMGWSAQQIAQGVAAAQAGQQVGPVLGPTKAQQKAAAAAAAAQAKAAAAQAKAQAKTQAAAAKAQAKAAAAAAKMGPFGGIGVGGLGGVAGRLGIGGILGGAAAAIAPGAALAKTFKAVKHQADDLITLNAQSMRQRRETDEIEARRATGEAVFGKGYERIERGIPKMLSAMRAKRGIAGEKGIMARLGLSQEDIAKAEKAGQRLDALDIAEKFAKQREKLEQAVDRAPSKKTKEQAQKKLDQFWKDLGLLGPEFTRAASFAPEVLKKFKQDQQAIQKAYGEGLPDQKKQVRDAQENLRLRTNLGNQFQEAQDRIGTIAMPGVNTALQALSDKLLQAGPAIATFAGHMGRIGWEGIAAAIEKIDGGALKQKFDDMNNALKDLDFKDLTVAKVTEGIQSVVDSALTGIWDTFTSSLASSFGGKMTDLPKFLADDFTNNFLPSLKENFKRLFEIPGNILDDLYRKLMGQPSREEEKAAIERKRKEDFPEGVPLPRPRPEEAPSIVPDLTPLQRIQEGFDALPGKASEAGAAFNSTVEAGISAAGSAGGTAFSGTASSGLTSAGQAAGSAFNGAVNASSIGAQIGAAAAAAISAAKVNVNVNVAGQATGGGGNKPSTGRDTPD